MTNPAKSLERDFRRIGKKTFGSLEKPVRTGATQQKRSQEQQKVLLAEQAQKAKASLAESESEVAKRQFGATASKRGRSLLIKTSQTGTKTLGGA